MLHKSKIVEGFLGETKPATFAYTDVREERRRVSTTKSPTRLTYAVSLLTLDLLAGKKRCNHGNTMSFPRKLLVYSGRTSRIGVVVSKDRSCSRTNVRSAARL
ncbi:hypothetical protein [Candidatus Tisiphia endosymbiont of Ptychoptera albimana]|uniref:hypothetical protein n=1 Tax=Candidatus Tisiphia endosymbiont of Ptychoptera albimana TaxID=3066260 RepID=UPI00312CB4EF